MSATTLRALYPELATLTSARAQDGWAVECQACGRWKWCSWAPSQQRSRPFELDRVTAHRCER